METPLNKEKLKVIIYLSAVAGAIAFGTTFLSQIELAFAEAAADN